MLGVDELRFWDMTPAETEAAYLRLRQDAEADRMKDEAEWNRTSLIAAILCNVNRGKNSTPVTPEAFNPYKQVEEAQTAEEHAAMMAPIFEKFKKLEGKEADGNDTR